METFEDPMILSKIKIQKILYNGALYIGIYLKDAVSQKYNLQNAQMKLIFEFFTLENFWLYSIMMILKYHSSLFSSQSSHYH